MSQWREAPGPLLFSEVEYDWVTDGAYWYTAPKSANTSHTD